MPENYNHTAMIFLINIRKKRIEKGISQEMMASELGISQSTYAKIENGQQKLPTRMLMRIANILDVPIDSLFEKK
ncbi:XRE family transcriptional regulator [Capnocytophaga canimorsus]|nr:XRE family transcriptional regulator [Capnocytophaga canimorsus]AYW36872.1 XRE family transcriptional regulator [Capnocytophaga canimorsus]